MKRLLMGISLIAAFAPCNAAWVLTHDNANASYYVDRETRIQNGNLVKMWTMIDFRKADVMDGRAYLSYLTLLEVDCQEKKFRKLQMTFYSGHKGSGESGYSESRIGDWSYAVPNSTGMLMISIACGK